MDRREAMEKIAEATGLHTSDAADLIDEYARKPEDVIEVSGIRVNDIINDYRRLGRLPPALPKPLDGKS